MGSSIFGKGYDQVKKGDGSFGREWFSTGGVDWWFVGEAARILRATPTKAWGIWKDF